MTIKKNGIAKYGKSGFAVIAFLLLSSLFYFVYQDDFKIMDTLKAKNESRQMQSLNANKININKDEQKVSEQGNSMNTANQQIKPNTEGTEVKETVQTEPDNKKSKYKIIGSDLTVEKTKVYKGKQISSIVTIDPDISIEDLRKEISNMLLSFGFTLEKNTSSGSYLGIKTKNITALSKNGNHVEYNVKFTVDKKNPSLLKMYLEYYVLDENINITDSKNTVEDMFYNKIANHLKHIFANN